MYGEFEISTDGVARSAPARAPDDVRCKSCGASVDRDRSLDYHRVPGGRKYLPTLAELIDRLTIVTLKEVNLPANREAYAEERGLILHDVDLVMREIAMKGTSLLTAEFLRAVAIVMLTNATIWANESRARAGSDDQDKLLKFTHSINGVRNAAKNVIAAASGERVDLKVDCFAAKLVEEFGNWNLFG